jgi:hypothetical protein
VPNSNEVIRGLWFALRCRRCHRPYSLYGSKTGQRYTVHDLGKKPWHNRGTMLKLAWRYGRKSRRTWGQPVYNVRFQTGKIMLPLHKLKGTPGGGGMPGCSSPKTPKLKLKKHSVCTYYDIKSFARDFPFTWKQPLKSNDWYIRILKIT